ncbi:DNA-binding MarR family transcriptional regulator [Nocardia tenerifensis]|uniref:DNA-binding MarR family transcriptional regulator n=1 Tax=Nocardia tenerifensis TaxID=228006 RepID=A0A318K186_9NOCA|nr:MarR family transcriptional regulator [Nocardia tenerifensis]PXX61741.1 DNA-binding MarR family transcriptional regulator [Nocardia tenerifensis]
MNSARRPDRSGTDLAATVEQAAARLVALWGQAQQAVGTTVSPSQLQALTIVQRHGQINLNGLAAELDAMPSSASRLCDRLQAAGLLARTASPANRREVMLALTRDGQRLLTEVSGTRRRELARVLQGMSSAGREALLTGLAEFTASADAAQQQRRA